MFIIVFSDLYFLVFHINVIITVSVITKIWFSYGIIGVDGVSGVFPGVLVRRAGVCGYRGGGGRGPRGGEGSRWPVSGTQSGTAASQPRGGG